MTTPEKIARDYIQAVSDHELAPLERLLDEHLAAVFAGGTFRKQEWIAALRRLLPALERNEILEVFVDGNRACVVYDFVTNTEAGAVRCVELLTIGNAAITHIELILDRVAFAPVNAALAAR